MSQIVKFEQKLQTAKSVKELFAMPDVRERFIKNYEAVTGKKDGENRLEQEKFAYLEIINEKPDLKSVDMFYHFAAIVKAGTTGLSFRDNKLYVIPSGKGLKVQSSPAGKREQLEMMPTVKRAPEAQVVMKGDVFAYDKLNQQVIRHETTEKSATTMHLDNIVAAYQRIQWTDGTFSDTVVYHDDLVKAKSKSRMKSDSGFWAEWPGEASKKVATNRAFRIYHKYPDNVVLYDNDKEDEETTYSDAEQVSTPAVETQEAEVIDHTTGEVMPEKKETKKKEVEPFG